jgi:hypothetical protein
MKDILALERLPERIRQENHTLSRLLTESEIQEIVRVASLAPNIRESINHSMEKLGITTKEEAERETLEQERLFSIYP